MIYLYVDIKYDFGLNRDMQYTSQALKRINHLVSELDQVYHLYALKYGLSDSEFAILYTLSVEGGECALSELVALSGIPKQTVNSALRKMEAEGTVYLTENGKRKKNVNFTDKGREKAERSVNDLIEIENSILNKWGKERVEQYIRDTEEYNELMKGGLGNASVK
ncbi:MAG: MarR family transcriptional regulator [Spirochaetales bacterium]|nr:MarR family transcriptional regulator [Spirochaetales bacterium]